MSTKPAHSFILSSKLKEGKMNKAIFNITTALKRARSLNYTKTNIYFLPQQS